MAYGLGRVVEGFAQGREDRRQIQRQESADERAEEMHGLSVKAKEMGIEASETEAERGGVRWEAEQERMQHDSQRRDTEADQLDRQTRYQRLSDNLNRALMMGEATGNWRQMKELWNSEIADEVGESKLAGMRVVIDEDGNRFVELKSEDGDQDDLPYEDFMNLMIGVASPDGMMQAHQQAQQARQEAAAEQQKHMNAVDLKLLDRDTRVILEEVKSDIRNADPDVTASQTNRITNNLLSFYGGQLQNGMFQIRADNREKFERANTIASRAFRLFRQAGQPITEAEAAMLGRQAADGPIDMDQAIQAATAEIELQAEGTDRRMSRAEKQTAINARAQEIVAASDQARQRAIQLGLWDSLTEPVEQRRIQREDDAQGDGGADELLRGAAENPRAPPARSEPRERPEPPFEFRVM